MKYQEVAENILKESIKTAVYIDEDLLEFYEEKSSVEETEEEKLSVELYSRFRKENVLLEPIKFKNGVEEDTEWLNYALKNRDLILLDWHLNGQSGEIQSLKILNEIIKTPGIQFCVIYTRTENLDDVFKRILSNFSSFSIDEYESLKELTQTLFGKGFDFSEFHHLSLGRNNPEIRKGIREIVNKHKSNLDLFKSASGIEDNLCSICYISNLNLDTFHKELSHPLPCPDYINHKKYLIEINNTLIVLFNKKTHQPNVLLPNFFNHIIESDDGFNKLLIIDFFNRISKVGITNHNNKINFGKEVMLEHWNRLKNEGLVEFYEEFIDELLMEKLNLSLSEKKSKLISDEILDELYKDKKKAKDTDKHKMNVFYNSFVLNKENSKINFGDVFEILDGTSKYLICITPLCDCIRPEKIDRNYFFAEGAHIKLNDALKVGDSAFINFLPNGKVVRWTDVSQSQDSKYVPIYIKPIQYKTLKKKELIDENNEVSFFSIDEKGEIQEIKAKYITTIRQNYTQRIANHAFTHPLRVGVDFVKDT